MLRGTDRSPSRRRSRRAYPRAGGGTVADSDTLTRSIPAQAGEPTISAGDGPIPAQAGEPVHHAVPGLLGAYRRAGGGTFDLDNPSLRAYPRAGGGTMGIRDPVDFPGYQGLSPRRRGNRGFESSVPRLGGPIPAQAGEPSLHRHPDAGGGTVGEGRTGPSGPIPAQAGEPYRGRSIPASGGGTSAPASAASGLSPRRRGNPLIPSP